MLQSLGPPDTMQAILKTQEVAYGNGTYGALDQKPHSKPGLQNETAHCSPSWLYNCSTTPRQGPEVDSAPLSSLDPRYKAAKDLRIAAGLRLSVPGTRAN